MCTSQSGLVNHQKNCKKCIKASKNNEKTFDRIDLIEFKNHPEVQEILDLTSDIAIDIQEALTNRNKSAARRARTAILELKEKAVLVRKKLLNIIKSPKI